MSVLETPQTTIGKTHLFHTLTDLELHIGMH